MISFGNDDYFNTAIKVQMSVVARNMFKAVMENAESYHPALFCGLVNFERLLFSEIP